MSEEKSLHSICRWTFNAGKGGFVPSDMRPEWDSQKFTTVDMIKLEKEKHSILKICNIFIDSIF